MLKEGDLALVINATVKQNIGKVVTIINITNDKIIFTPEGHSKLNERRQVCCVIKGELISVDQWGMYATTVHGVFPIEWLMPLNNPDQVIETTKELELTH